MPEVKVTQSLREIIKTYRKEIQLRGDVLSRSLKKNTSFISQLETGKIEVIDTEILRKIFDALFEHESPEVRSRKIDSILKQLELSLSDNELKRQEWMRVMDLQYRTIPIPDTIINYINEKLKKNNLLPADVIAKLNLNESLYIAYTEEEILAMEDNQVYCNLSGTGDTMYIKFNLPTDYLSDILTKKIVRCNFINLQGIIHAILLLEGLSEDEAFSQSEQVLFKHKFNTILRKQHLPQNEPMENFLAPYDIEFQEQLEHLTYELSIINDRQPDFLNKILKVFIKNIHKEPTIIFSIISKDVSVLHKMSKENKRNFVNEYKELIAKYAENSVAEQQKIETF